VSLGNPDRPVGGLAVPMPPGVELRPFGRDDLADALALAREMYALPETDRETYRARFDALINDVDATPFLAIADGEPAGFVGFSFRRRLNHATFEGWLSDLFVREPFRRRGIGRALLAAAIAEWRLRGGHQVMTEVSYDRAAARELLAAAGFVDGGKLFEISPVVARGIAAGPGVEVRAITDDDADFDAVTKLLAELGRPAPTDEKLPALRRTYSQHVVRPDTASMLALLDGAAVGFISLEFRDRFFRSDPQAWIPDLIVAEAARGHRIGAALLDAAFAESLWRGAFAAVLESGHQRSVAHRLYSAAGMADLGSYFTLGR
jgi:GNAT superfamily N-acetyltransferase